MVCSILKTSASFFILRVSKHETSGQTSEESTSHGVSFRTENQDDMPNTNVTKHEFFFFFFNGYAISHNK